MSSVLYYSKYCENCKKLLYELGKTKIQKDVHFLSIDKRIQRGKNTYIILENGNEISGNKPNINYVDDFNKIDFKKNNKFFLDITQGKNHDYKLSVVFSEAKGSQK